MKKLLLTAGFIASTLAAAPLFAGATEAITGCATAPAENSNFTVFVDPTCHKVPEGGNGLDAALFASLIDALAGDDEEQPAAE